MGPCAPTCRSTHFHIVPVRPADEAAWRSTGGDRRAAPRRRARRLPRVAARPVVPRSARRSRSAGIGGGPPSPLTTRRGAARRNGDAGIASAGARKLATRSDIRFESAASGGDLFSGNSACCSSSHCRRVCRRFSRTFPARNSPTWDKAWPPARSSLPPSRLRRPCGGADGQTKKSRGMEAADRHGCQARPSRIPVVNFNSRPTGKWIVAPLE